MLSRLWAHLDRAPQAYLLCDDAEVAGADFFVMERRSGEGIRGMIPESMREHADVAHHVGTALVEAIAASIASIRARATSRPRARPDGFAERQVKGWKTRWYLVADPAQDPAMGAVHARLAKAIRDPQRVSFVHNDLKLDNCMFDPANPDRVIAFFDWDMTTLGDPLIDLGTLLDYWQDPEDGDDSRGTQDGMEMMALPTRAEVRKIYTELAGLDDSSIDWCEAFALRKTATVIAQFHHSGVVGDSTDPRRKPSRSAFRSWRKRRAGCRTDSADRSLGSQGRTG